MCTLGMYILVKQFVLNFVFNCTYLKITYVVLGIVFLSLRFLLW